MLDYKKYGLKKFLLGYLIIMSLTLIASICSILTFTLTIAPRFKGMASVFIFSIIPIVYVGAYVLVLQKSRRFYYNLLEKDKFILDISKQTLMYISILLVVFFIFIISLRYSLEKRGENDILLSLNVQPYLTNDIFERYNETSFSEINNIYKEYNVSVNINPPINLNFSFNESEKKLIFEQNCTFIDKVYETINGSSNTVKLILINTNNSIDGMGSFCGKGDLIIMSINSSLPSYWVLSHELGHVLSAKIECWRFNLMKEFSNGVCWKGTNWFVHDYIRDLKPDYLNQEQVNSIVESIKTRFS
jgi:hypothetical protein